MDEFDARFHADGHTQPEGLGGQRFNEERLGSHLGGDVDRLIGRFQRGVDRRTRQCEVRDQMVDLRRLG